MKCVNCEKFSTKIICKDCTKILSQISLSRRNFGDFAVYYFYYYSEIQKLILSKHHEYGYFVYKTLANLTFRRFTEKFEKEVLCSQNGAQNINIQSLNDNTSKENFKLKNEKFALKFGCLHKNQTLANALPLDDNIRSGYSHTAILAHALKSNFITPIYRTLRAKNHVSYAGKSLAFRLKNPRNFEIFKKPKFPIILVDDIVTTGSSLLEAKKTLENAGFSVLFGLVLANAEEN